MDVADKQNKQQTELYSKLWSIANDLRGTMEASEFKNYILGLIFYRFLSERLVLIPISIVSFAMSVYFDSLNSSTISLRSSFVKKSFTELLASVFSETVNIPAVIITTENITASTILRTLITINHPPKIIQHILLHILESLLFQVRLQKKKE